MIVLATAYERDAQRMAVAALLLRAEVAEPRLLLTPGGAPQPLLRRPLDIPEKQRLAVTAHVRARATGYAVITGPANDERTQAMTVLAVCRALERARHARRDHVAPRELLMVHAALPIVPSRFVCGARQRRCARFGDWRCGAAWLLAVGALSFEVALVG